ncbi:hypothetical protein MJO29_005358 [Puccinia striiformis f. sp. tritici]|nr:hypothetical protein MJO29_005358 [Puccinia striiformis f. sp. tritici]
MSKLGTSNIVCPATTNSEPVDYDTQDMAQTEDHTTPVDDDDDDQIDIPDMPIDSDGFLSNPQSNDNNDLIEEIAMNSL